MKKYISLGLTLLLLSGCSSSNQLNGVLTGGMIGGVFGSSIGGLMGGPRGGDAGNLVGMVIGGAVGAAVTAPKGQENRRQGDYYDEEIDQYNRRSSRKSNPQRVPQGEALKKEYQALQIENLRFIDPNNNHAIDAGEQCKIEFEIHNKGEVTIYDVAPVISVANGKHIVISPTAIVASIAPGRGVRYAAEVYGKPSLRTGQADFSLGFAKGDLLYTVRTFQISTYGK